MAPQAIREAGMRIYPRGKRGILWVDVTVAGQRVTRSSGTTFKAAAQEWAARLTADLWRQRRLGEKPRIAFGEAVLDWIQKYGDAPVDRGYEGPAALAE
jgi:hypothetical protein